MPNIIKFPAKRKAKVDKLKAEVATLVATQAVSHAGHEWAAVDQPSLAARLGVSVRTLKRRVDAPGIVTTTKLIDGRPQYLIRVGKPDSVDPNVVIAKEMSTAWRKALSGRRTNPREFGCLVGLAKVWPAGQQLAIFRHALKEWHDVMACIKLASHELPQDQQKTWFFDYPCIAVMRRFSDAVYEAWLTHQQAEHPSKCHLMIAGVSGGANMA